jgi:D-lactate dehydrogenase
MKVTVFSARPYDRLFLKDPVGSLEFRFVDVRLDPSTVSLARGSGAVCVFVHDQLDAPVLEELKGLGVGLVALRCAGFNKLDMERAKALGIAVVRVPEYSPYSVAEHAFGLLLMLNRKLHRAQWRVREGNFNLDGLMGFDLHGKSVGVIGTGRIGTAFAKIALGFGCRVFACDPNPEAELKAQGVEYLSLPKLLKQCKVISLHLPLTPSSHHLISDRQFQEMQLGAILVNTSRGGLVDSAALIRSLKSGRLGGACLDVYELEEGVFFQDSSQTGIADDQLSRLVGFPNVVLTGHQAFFTEEAMTAIAETTISNLHAFASGGPLHHRLC